MKKLIRSRTTRAFLTRDGQWTHELKHAEDFTWAVAAVKQKFALSDIEVYYSFADEKSEFDFALPLS